MSVSIPYGENLKAPTLQGFVLQSLPGTGGLHSQGGVESTPPRLLGILMRLGMEIPSIVFNGFVDAALDKVKLEKLSLERDVEFTPVLRKVGFSLKLKGEVVPYLPKKSLTLLGSTPAQIGQGRNSISPEKCLLPFLSALWHVHEMRNPVLVLKPLSLPCLDFRDLGDRGYPVSCHAGLTTIFTDTSVLKRVLNTITCQESLFAGLFEFRSLEMVESPIPILCCLQHLPNRARWAAPIHTLENLMFEVSELYTGFRSTITAVEQFFVWSFCTLGTKAHTPVP